MAIVVVINTNWQRDLSRFGDRNKFFFHLASASTLGWILSPDKHSLCRISALARPAQ